MASYFNYKNQFSSLKGEFEDLLSSEVIMENESDEFSEFRSMEIMVNPLEAGIMEAIAEDTESGANSTKEAALIAEKYIEDILCSIEVIKTYLLSSKDKVHELTEEKTDEDGNGEYLKNIFKELYEDQSEVILFTTNIYKNLIRDNMADYLDWSDICEKTVVPQDLLSQADDEGENNRHFIKLEEGCQDFLDGKINKEEYVKIIQEEEDFLGEVIKGCNSHMIEQGFGKEDILNEMDNLMGSYARGLTYLKLFSSTKDPVMRRKGLENILQSLKNIIITGNLFDADAICESYASGDLLDVVGYMDPIRQKQWEKLYGGNRPQKNLEKLPPGQANTGQSNTGQSNTGQSNTGQSNTGQSNTGQSNTGQSNTGQSNTGQSNTGQSNTGKSNTGQSNTGQSNTGQSNTGQSNTGQSNTGQSNTGKSNTGQSTKQQPAQTQNRANEATRIIRRKASEETTQIIDRSKLGQEDKARQVANKASKATGIADKTQKVRFLTRLWNGIKGVTGGAYRGVKSEGKAALSQVSRTGGAIMHRLAPVVRAHPVATGVAAGISIAGGIGYYVYKKLK
jgi:hypothetical protein